MFFAKGEIIMNNIYKVIWSKAKNCYVVASEIARSHTKSATGSRKIGGVTRRSLLASLMALSLLCGGLGVASAVDVVHVDENATGAAEVYTKTGVDTLLDKKADKTAVEEIKNTVGGVDSGLVKKTNDNATGIEVNRTSINALKDTVGDDTKGLTKKINDNATAINTLTTNVNAKADANTVNDISTRVGTLETTVGNDTGGLVKDVNEAKTDITNIKNTIGDASNGLVKNVAALETKVGDASSGLVKDVADLKTQGSNLNTAIGNKADQSGLDAATNRISTNEGNITALQTKTAKLSDDGTELNGMTTVGTGALKVTGGISNGTGVTTTLTDIKASMDKANANETAIGQLQTTTTNQQTAIDGLNKKTTKITYDASNGTSVDGVTFNAGAVTGVTSINGTVIGTKESGTYIHQDSSIWGNMKNVDTQVTTNADNIKKNKDDITALDTKVGTVGVGTYLDSTKSVGENLGRLNAGLEKEVGDRTAAVDAEKAAREAEDSKLSDRIGTVAEDGKYIKKSATNNVSENLIVLDTQAKTNADAIAQETADRKAAIGELAVNGNYIEKDKNVSDNLVKLDNQAKANADAITETNQRTHGITRDDTRNETRIEGRVTVDTDGNIKAEGTITSNGLDARAGEIKTTGKVSAGDVSTGTLETTGNAKIGGDLTVNGKLNVGEIYMEHKKQESTGEKYDSATSITADGISNNAKVTDRNGVTTESKFTHDKEGSTTYAYKGNDADWKEATSNVTADGVENIAKDSKGNNNTFTQTSTDTKNILKDKDGNTSTTRQDSKGIYGYAKDKDGNKSYTKQEGNRIAESVIGQDGKQTKSEMNSTDITNTAKDGTITNTAKNVTNEGTESVTNKVGNNEVKVSQDGVDIKAEAGKKITESVGTASRVVENDKITDKAADSTVTTENGKGTTFGKEGSTGTTNIYGDSIRTGTINAEDTTTAKLTAGAAAGADGGRLTVDASDGVKGSYKSGDYTSRSYILANTLKSGVDNGKEPTEDDFVGSRTDHYMDGNKAKLDETVKDADGSNVTNKKSTGTVTTITDGTTTTKTDQGVKDITNTAKNGTITNDAKDIVNIAKDTITNTAGTSITNQVNDSKVTTDANGTTFENNTPAVSDSGATTTKINGNQITTGRVNANELDVSDTDGNNKADLLVKAGEGVKASASDGNTTGSLDVKADGITTSITYGTDHNTVSSTLAGGTIFTNSEAAAPVTGASGAGTAVNTTIKGNTITTGKVTMDYAEVMKDLSVRGNANITGKTTTGSLEVTGTSTLKGEVTMESNATVKKDLKVEGTTTTKTLKVTENAEIDGNATIKGDVTAKSYKVGDKTYIDANGVNANDQKITNVADGSISEGSKDAVNGGQLYGVKRDLEHQVDKVGANAAAMANLRPMEFDPSSKWNIAAAIGNYGSETAAALGAFYRPNDDVMVNLSTAFGTGENMVGGGVSVRLGKSGNKLSREENNALKAQVDDLTARMDALLSVLNPNMSKDFPDVPENHWAYEAVSRLAGNDIVQGYPDGEFHGERTMTRYEMAEIIYNALSRGAEAERELVEEFKPELQAMAASEKATAEKAEG